MKKHLISFLFLGTFLNTACATQVDQEKDQKISAFMDLLERSEPEDFADFIDALAETKDYHACQTIRELGNNIVNALDPFKPIMTSLFEKELFFSNTMPDSLVRKDFEQMLQEGSETLAHDESLDMRKKKYPGMPLKDALNPQAMHHMTMDLLARLIVYKAKEGSHAPHKKDHPGISTYDNRILTRDTLIEMLNAHRPQERHIPINIEDDDLVEALSRNFFVMVSFINQIFTSQT